MRRGTEVEKLRKGDDQQKPTKADISRKMEDGRDGGRGWQCARAAGGWTIDYYCMNSIILRSSLTQRSRLRHIKCQSESSGNITTFGTKRIPRMPISTSYWNGIFGRQLVGATLIIIARALHRRNVKIGIFFKRFLGSVFPSPRSTRSFSLTAFARDHPRSQFSFKLPSVFCHKYTCVRLFYQSGMCVCVYVSEWCQASNCLVWSNRKVCENLIW